MRDTEKLEPLCVAGGDLEGYSCYRKWCDDSSKNENKGYHMIQQFHSNITHNSQKVKQPKCALVDGQINKMWYVYE